MVSRKVFWGARRPFITGMVTPGVQQACDGLRVTPPSQVQAAGAGGGDDWRLPQERASTARWERRGGGGGNGGGGSGSSPVCVRSLDSMAAAAADGRPDQVTVWISGPHSA